MAKENFRRTTITYTSEKYGVFHIENFEKNKSCIWWDFYDEQEGSFLEPGYITFEECNVKDFSDMPKGGIFSSEEEAKKYLIKKFGEIK